MTPQERSHFTHKLMFFPVCNKIVVLGMDYDTPNRTLIFHNTAKIDRTVCNQSILEESGAPNL